MGVVDQEFDTQMQAVKLKMKKENLDLSNSMIKKFEQEKEQQILLLLQENDSLKQ